MDGRSPVAEECLPRPADGLCQCCQCCGGPTPPHRHVLQRICSVSQPVSAPRLKGDGWGQRDEVSAPPLQRPAVSAVSSLCRRIRRYGAVTLDNGRFLASSNEVVSRGQGYGRPIRSTSISDARSIIVSQPFWDQWREPGLHVQTLKVPRVNNRGRPSGRPRCLFHSQVLPIASYPSP